MTKLPLTVLSFVFFALVNIPHSLCADPPASSPAPAPELGADAVPPPSISSSPPLSSPPSPPPADLSPKTSPSPSPTNDDGFGNSPSPTPSPSTVAADLSKESTADLETEKSSDGLNGGQKAGIAVGVIAGVCVVGLGALVYKKRQQNIQRSEFGYAARREIL